MAVLFKRRRGEDMPGVDGNVRVTTGELWGKKLHACTFCGNDHASAYWRGTEAWVAVCRGCAVAALPALLADALVGEHGDYPNAIGGLHRMLDKVLLAFPRAVAIATHRCAQTTRLEREDGEE
jgi:hypothetical protein